MTTEMIGQAQTVDSSNGPDKQADGYREPSPLQKRIGEIALDLLGLIVNARYVEGVIRLTNGSIDTLSYTGLASEIQAAQRVINAISEAECEEIALRHGL